MTFANSAVAFIQQAPAAAPVASSDSPMGQEVAGAGDSVETTISSLADLRQKAPQVYHLMMVSLGQKICHQMDHAQKRLKEINREHRRNARG